MKNRTVLIALAGLLTACGYSMEDIVVSGTVTYQGTPAVSGQASLTAGTVAGTADFEAGGYLVRSELEPSSCAAVSISVLVLDESGDVVGEGTRILGACGEHIVDFAFD